MKKLSLLVLFYIIMSSQIANAGFLLGVGKADITGPVFDVATMGYAAPAPKGSGLHQRLWARAFVIEDKESQKIVALVNVDLCFVTIAVKEAVIAQLSKEMSGAPFSVDNTMIMATHNHNAPGGFSQHEFYNKPTHGLVIENFNVIVTGIVQSIKDAYGSKAPGHLEWAQGELSGASINRSLAAYLKNSKFERDKYQNSTDLTNTILKFVDLQQKPLGVLNWFAVHATSVKKKNTLITGDNKGYAAQKFENEMKNINPNFVAGFANSNAGDSSPNTAGNIIGDEEWECALAEGFACARDSGDRQQAMAKKLFDNSEKIQIQKLNYVHSYVDFNNNDLNEFGLDSTCSAAIGVSMLAGSAEDGKGVGKEGQSCSSGSGVLVKRGCSRPRFSCHGEKPVVLMTGNIDWHPEIIPLQLMQIGELVFVALPAEFTTMAGRRLRELLMEKFRTEGVKAVVLAGYANGYSSYVATPEEYQLQHYEGAFTLYGENTLWAYIKEYSRLAVDLIVGRESSGIAPVDMGESVKKVNANRQSISGLQMQKLGQSLVEPKAKYVKGETVKWSVIMNNPNLLLHYKNREYFKIQKYKDGKWLDYLSDDDWNTRFNFKSFAGDIEWKLTADVDSGTYRIWHQGVYDDQSRTLYTSVSQQFQVQ